MNAPLPKFRYQHLAPPRVLNDARKNRKSDIVPAQVYFVGFRIAAKSGDQYHHAMILADDYLDLHEGIAGEYNDILDQSIVSFAYDISVIFIRNLLVLETEVSEVTERHNIKAQIQKALSKRNDDQFVVYGLIENKKLCLLKATARNGLLAMEIARNQIGHQFNKEFIPLEICQAHPVRFEFEELFNTAVERFESLIERKSASKEYLH